MDIFGNFKLALEKHAKGKTVTPETMLKDLGIDSLDLLNLVIDAEEHFQVQIDENRLRDVKTVADVVLLFEEKVQK